MTKLVVGENVRVLPNGEVAIANNSEVERLEASNKVLRDACEHVVKWLGEPKLEDSDTANDAFKKALKKCRAVLTEEPGHE